jgi:hypothetical protein
MVDAPNTVDTPSHNLALELFPGPPSLGSIMNLGSFSAACRVLNLMITFAVAGRRSG